VVPAARFGWQLIAIAVVIVVLHAAAEFIAAILGAV
jgi:hypothetical protein